MVILHDSKQNAHMHVASFVLSIGVLILSYMTASYGQIRKFDIWTENVPPIEYPNRKHNKTTLQYRLKWKLYISVITTKNNICKYK